MNPSIEQIDNVFPKDISKFVSQYYIRKAKYHYGEVDNPDQEPTGLTAQSFYYNGSSHYIDDDSRVIYDSFKKSIESRYKDFFRTNQIYRLYCNCFAPREFGNFHTDADDEEEKYTFLYYPEHEYKFDIEEGGWTEFYINDKIIGILPKPNSMVRFTSQIIHRASPMRTHTRFSVALKTMPKKVL